jgi:hypothetical protein
MKKGASKRIHIDAGLKVKAAGMELSEYVMPGLGGKEFSDEHARESADALNEINPDFIRLRPLAVPIRAPLFEIVQSGDFEVLSETEVAAETRVFIESLDGISSQLVSDHILNLFGDLNGNLPDEKDHLLSIIDRFLGMDEDTQTFFIFGRRLGAFNSLEDMADKRKAKRIRKAIQEHNINADNLHDIVARIKQRFI